MKTIAFGTVVGIAFGLTVGGLVYLITKSDDTSTFSAFVSGTFIAALVTHALKK